MTDIVDRLRIWAGSAALERDLAEAAAAIERLRSEDEEVHVAALAEIERLTKASDLLLQINADQHAEIERLRAQVNTNWISDRAIHRSDALEEAAKWLEECEGQEIADAIRALKGGE
jgi:hypothetical protein